MKQISDHLKTLSNKNYKPIVKKNSKPLGKIIDSEMTFDQFKILWGKIAGPDFKYTDENKTILNKMVAYFLHDERILDYPDLNPFKGILLVGNKGTGKTTIFMIFQRFLQAIQEIHFRPIVITSIDRIKQHYALNGNLDKYLYNESTSGHSPELVVNELGFMYESKIFGTNFNELIVNLMMLRYEIFKERGVITHATSNLDTSELEKVFDPMVYERLKEMFNVIYLDGPNFR